MTQNAFRDPTSRRALGVNVFEDLVRALASLDESPRIVAMLRFGLLGRPPMSYREIAHATRQHPLVVQMWERRALRGLRASPALAHLLDGDALPEVPGVVRERLVGMAPQTLRLCERHGWVVTSDTSTRCAECVCPLTLADVGRPRRHCSGACRQAAYRRRCAGTGRATNAARGVG